MTYTVPTSTYAVEINKHGHALIYRDGSLVETFQDWGHAKRYLDKVAPCMGTSLWVIAFAGACGLFVGVCMAIVVCGRLFGHG